MDTVEIKILTYVFLFRRLRWRDEFAIKFKPQEDPYRVLMSHALLSVSGVPTSTVEDAQRILNALPQPIMTRLYKVWRGSFPPSRRFVTASLYKAPDPLMYEARVAIEEMETEEAGSSAIAALEAKFGEEQMQEARELSQKILKASQLRGAVAPTGGGENDE